MKLPRGPRVLVLLTSATALLFSTSLSAQTLDGAKLTVMTEARSGKVCPRSTFTVLATGGEESLAGVMGGIVTTFVGKALGAFVDWLKERDERLDGMRTATFTGEFYDKNAPRINATCIIFSAGTFGSEGVTDEKVYAEFVPVTYPDGVYTLKPVYLSYRETVARARKREKFASIVISTKYNVPKSDKEAKEAGKKELTEGAIFTFNFGQLSRGTTLDHIALEGVAVGLGPMAPQLEGAAGEGSLRPITYEMTAVWSETAEPSPLYTTAIDSISDNKDTIGKEIGTAIKEILGLNEDSDD